MALWGNAKLFFCILFITWCCWTVTLAEVPMDCCLVVSKKSFHKSKVVDYRRQISGQGCSIEAMIFVSRGGRNLCIAPNESWIQEVMKHVDNLKKHCKKQSYRGGRCNGVKPE